jgi:hypothetical protein
LDGDHSLIENLEGKEAVLDELFAAIKSTLVQPFRVVADQFIADGDYVIVESLGQNATPT